MARKDGTIHVESYDGDELATLIDDVRKNFAVHSSQTHIVPVTQYAPDGTPMTVVVEYHAFVYHYGPNPTPAAPIGMKKPLSCGPNKHKFVAGVCEICGDDAFVKPEVTS